MTKGILIRRDGCIWGHEVTDLTFRKFSDKLEAFAEEEGGFSSPYIIQRRIGGVEYDIWYDENFLAYLPVPSGVCLNYKDEVLLGMLFITRGDDSSGDEADLTEEDIKLILENYKVPDMKTCQGRGGLGMMMLGYKLIHYEV